jgi:hypothetical protein
VVDLDEGFEQVDIHAAQVSAFFTRDAFFFVFPVLCANLESLQSGQLVRRLINPFPEGTRVMKISAVALAMALALALSVPGVFAADADEAEAQCRQWAKEDNVAQDELAQYVADCVADQMAAANESASAADKD